MAHKDMVGAAMAAAPPQPIAGIEVQLFSDGRVVAKAKVPNRQTMLMMMETAKLDLNELFRDREKLAAAQAIEVAPPGLLLPN